MALFNGGLAGWLVLGVAALLGLFLVQPAGSGASFSQVELLVKLVLIVLFSSFIRAILKWHVEKMFQSLHLPMLRHLPQPLDAAILQLHVGV